MSVIRDVLKMVIIDHEDLYERVAMAEAHQKLRRSTNGLLEQLARETGVDLRQKGADGLIQHFDRTLSPTAQRQWTMVQDHLAQLLKLLEGFNPGPGDESGAHNMALYLAVQEDKSFEQQSARVHVVTCDGCWTKIQQAKSVTV